MNILLQHPEQIRLESLVPTLTKNRQFQQIVRLCLHHCNWVVKRQDDVNLEDKELQAKELLDLIVELVEAFDTAIVSGSKFLTSARD